MARMRKDLVRAALIVAFFAPSVLVSTQSGQVSDRAKQLHNRAIVIDSHDDTTQRLVDESEEMLRRHRRECDDDDEDQA